jgi:hypothetical protein
VLTMAPACGSVGMEARGTRELECQRVRVDGWPSGYVPPKGEPSPTRYSAAHEKRKTRGRPEDAWTFQRYLSAIKALARVRKMGPAVQINIADKQINTAG